jgi:hypothetical protein
MRALTLVLPFSLAPPELAKDLLAQLRAPAMAKLLAKAKLNSKKTFSGLDPCLPHERWLSVHSSDTSPAMAAALMSELGLNNETGYWFVVQPVHLHVARDHLVLTDYRKLELDVAQSRVLFDAALPLFEELNHRLLFGNEHYWFMQANSWTDLRTSTPDAACGHNIDAWLPTGASARDWRRLQNEVQMLWHQHPLNDTREQTYQPRINGLWLWGGCTMGESTWGLDAMASHLIHPAIPIDLGSDKRAIQLLDTLISPALAGDWSSWMQSMSTIDQQTLAPALSALENGTLDVLNVILSDSTRMSQWTLRPSSLRKFWAKPSLSRLAS